MGRRQALLLNLLTSLTSMVGAAAAYFAFSTVQQYLPYAIVFGATTQRARAFESLALPAPEWYVSGHPFTTLALANAMGEFSDRSVSAITFLVVPPSRFILPSPDPIIERPPS